MWHVLRSRVFRALYLLCVLSGTFFVLFLFLFLFFVLFCFVLFLIWLNSKRKENLTYKLFNKNWKLLFSTGHLTRVDANTCEVANERNRHNEWKWVLPYPNPCGCTKIIMGGMNTWTPIRPFVPTYVETPLLSHDVDEIRRHYRLKCNKGKF